jgi:hypothetical protein
MLLTKTVFVNITHRNKNFYINKKYTVIVGELLEVITNDLPDKSGQKLNVQCDYCPEIYTIRYCDYIRTERDFMDKDACKKCWHKKRMDITKYKVDNKLIDDPSTRGYWSIVENIKNELNNYIIQYGHTGKSNNEEQIKKWHMIHWGLKKHNLQLEDVVLGLGYYLEELQLRNPNGYTMPFDELKNKIDGFVKEHGFFPDQKQIAKDLNIHSKLYQKHGNLDELREKLGYNHKRYLVDNRGFINKSSYEIVVANYLIAQNIPYKREQEPFRKFNDTLRYRSDFTFYLSNKEIHVEVWGGMKIFNGQKSLYDDYESVMNTKLALYKKYNVELVSITPDIFYNSISMIKKKLYNIFSQYINLPFIEVKDRLVSTYTLHEMSDDELLIEIMKYSNYTNALPSHIKLRENKHEFLFIEVLKRYDSIKNFADKYNLYTARDVLSKKVQPFLLTS